MTSRPAWIPRIAAALTASALLLTGTPLPAPATPDPRGAEDRGSIVLLPVDRPEATPAESDPRAVTAPWSQRFAGEPAPPRVATGSPDATRPGGSSRAGTPARPPAGPSAGRDDVLAVARRLTGIPYVWGGSTTSGFDCSGYTRHVFAAVGVRLPRTAAQQQRASTRVWQPRPGDLVFFGNPAHHVGIYAGPGRMYDAPRRGRTTGLHRIWSSDVSYGRPG